MDGFESDTKVIVLAATNRPEALDPALCRPGRFSRKVLVGEPDEEGRRRILGVHLRGVPVEEDVELICDLVASLTPGFVGADLANIVNEAALLAARRGASKELLYIVFFVLLPNQMRNYLENFFAQTKTEEGTLEVE